MSIQNNFPAIKPTLLLDFANTEELDPRITFTRASTATYYGTQTAKAEENLLLQSQTFDNSSWVKTTTTVTANSFAAPDGTTTAETLTATGANSTILQTFTALALPYTFSVWLYRLTGTGNIDITVDGSTYSTQAITGAWVRYSVTTTPSAGSKTAGVRLATSGDEVYVWGAQLEQRSAVTAYTPTTTQAITNYIPQLLTAASGVARFDHNPTTFESLGLEIEESRTNLVTYSEQFDNAAWTTTNATITANTIVSPDGTVDADSISETTATGSHRTRTASISVSASTSYTCTVFAKLGFGSVRYLGIGLSSTTDLTTGSRRSYVFDLSNGTATTTGGATWTVVSGSATAVGNGWYRCQMTVTTDAAASTMFVSIGLSNTFSAATFASGYTGDGYSGIYIWGAQLEAGAFATSYIPTVASQVTRAADAASMTGTNFSSWYNAAEGTLYAEAATSNTSATSAVAAFSDGTANNRWQFNKTSSAAIQGFASTSGTNDFSQNLSPIVANVFFKSSFAITANNVNTSLNGSAGTTDTSVLMPVVTTLDLGQRASASFLNGTIRKIAYYPIRVSNTNLQALTS